MKIMKKYIATYILILIGFWAQASYILIPMDAESQTSHLKAYGLTYFVLNQGGEGAMIMDMAIEMCRVPQNPIGLQAHAILFGGIRAKAATPWWGDGTRTDS